MKTGLIRALRAIPLTVGLFNVAGIVDMLFVRGVDSFYAGVFLSLFV